MAQKRDDGHPGQASEETAAGLDADEFDDSETSEVAEQAADPASNDRDGAERADSLELPDLDPVQVGDSVGIALEPGDILSHRYQIVSLVHSGGMGRVYKAIDSRRHSDGAEQVHVAIKAIRQSVAADMDVSLAIEREAATAQRLSHPNIINVYDFNEQDGLFFLIMEWLEGESLLSLLKRTQGRRVAPHIARHVIEGISAALEYAHSRGVVHADINPSNVFITDTQDVKLLDFGVARYGDGKQSATGDDSVWATRSYTSPEVLSGLRPVIADDIFSLGCVAYRLLSGTLPFGRATAMEAAEQDLPIRRIPELTDTEWQDLEAALSYSRADRPATIGNFLRADPPVDPAARRSVTASRRDTKTVVAAAATVAAIAVIAIAGTWWLSQAGVFQTPASSDVSAEAGDAAVNVLLERARVAIDQNRLIAPEDNNARSYFRTVLAIEPTNVGALGGLREVSDAFIEQANVALRADAPASATEALSIAAETDPTNPAIAIVEELLRARGDRLLADALMAATTGDEERAAQLLFDAERYPHTDPDRINVVRDEITETVLERQFLSWLAQAETHMAASRLTRPAGSNAYETLFALIPQYGSDPRLQTSVQRLSERLLLRAAFSTAAGDFAEAGRLLDVAGSLGVLAAEIASARDSLQVAMDDAAGAEQTLDGDSAIGTSDEETLSGLAAGALVSLPEAVDEPVTDAASTEALTTDAMPEPDAAVASSASAPPIDEPAIDLGLIPDSSEVLAAATPASGMKVDDEPEKVGFTTLADLGILDYVPPRFPPRAERLGASGFVEVRFQIDTDGSTSAIDVLRSEPGTLFDTSARRAVEQWRFPTRDESLTTQLRLTFELASP